MKRNMLGFAFVLSLSVMQAADAVGQLSNAVIKVSVETRNGHPVETFSIKSGEAWMPALETSAFLYTRIDTGFQACSLRQAVPIENGLRLDGRCAVGSFEQRVMLTEDEHVLDVMTRLTLTVDSPLHSVEDRYDFLPERHPSKDEHTGPLDFVWSQNIKSEADDLISANDFKSPAIMMQQGSVFVAILPKLNNHHTEPLALDLDVSSGARPWLAFGAVATEPHDHSYFRRSLKKTITPLAKTVTYQYSLMLSSEPARMGYRHVVRRLWQQSGHPALLESASEQRNTLRPEWNSFESWQQEAWHNYADRVYRKVDCGGADCGTLSSDRNYKGDWDHPEPDAWFNAWFQTLRTAYGWYIHGQATNDKAMMAKAESVLSLALSSPRKEGAFSTIYLVLHHEWVPGDGWASYADSYHSFSMSWTAYWMLRWAEDLTPQRKPEILGFVRSYGDFLLAHQQASGVIPSWYRADTLKPREEFRDFNAETAPSALFLAELGKVAGDERYTKAAEHAMDFVGREVVPRQRWFDFETYRSCARKDYGFYDPWTEQYPQNNLAEMQAPQAMLTLYRLTGKQEYLERGTQMLDYLLLTQQVWNNPLFTPMLLGGFTTQNTDAEWSDARQSYAATLLNDYYQATGNVEYLERAVAAARSTFAVAPWENWAHTGYGDEPGALTGFHWGTGSAMASIEMMQPTLGDALVDVKARRGTGFDQCTINDVQVDAGRITFQLTSPDLQRAFLVRFRGLASGQIYTISWNGNPALTAHGEQLLKDGLVVPPLMQEQNKHIQREY